MLLGHGMIGLASPYVVERTGISLGLFEFDWQEMVLIPGLVVLASLVGFLPAVAAYRTDVAKVAGGQPVACTVWRSHQAPRDEYTVAERE